MSSSWKTTLFVTPEIHTRAEETRGEDGMEEEGEKKKGDKNPPKVRDWKAHQASSEAQSERG